MATKLKRLRLRVPRSVMAPETHDSIEQLVEGTAFQSVLQLWLLRILVPLSGHKVFLGKWGFAHDAVAEKLGLENWLDQDFENFEVRSAILRTLREAHLAAERNARHGAIPATLATNISRIADLVGLSQTDCRILEFAVILHSNDMLEDITDSLGECSSMRVCTAIASILNIPKQSVQDSLNLHAPLARSGLLSTSANTLLSTLKTKLDLISATFADSVASSLTAPIEVLADMVRPATPAHLDFEDFEHITPHLKLLRPYLAHATQQTRTGVNILIYGRPGTGKSQLARVLAKELGTNLFEVTSQNSEGDSISGGRRFRAYKAAQSFFVPRQSLILFDEVEDVFFDDSNEQSGLFGPSRNSKTSKAWINQTLEENKIPTLWISNSIHGLDAAFIRRFDMVIELPIPPRKQRARLIQEHCGGFLSASAMTRMSKADMIAPAVLTRAAGVVQAIQSKLATNDTETALELLVNSTLKAQGHGQLAQDKPDDLPEIYDAEFINADSDVSRIAAGLLKSRSGRICLYGPPGTGKTAYARWLAQQLEIPLLVKRGSDLIDMYVGGSEKNIAAAFDEARQEGALLLMDEVDSFLQDRRGAKRSWEVTLVNEMLTQIESFPGIFVASTNLMSGLDQAALRRFDRKVQFTYLLPAQSQALLRRYSTEMAFPAPTVEELAGVSRLQNLTPGDFAAVYRRHRFDPIDAVTQLIEALSGECAIKEGTKSTIGFF